MGAEVDHALSKEKGILEQPGSSTTATITSDDSHDAEKLDGDYGSTTDHIFSNDLVADYWRDVYEKAKYEGRHRFDPQFQWSAAEEKRVRRKVRDLLQTLKPPY